MALMLVSKTVSLVPVCPTDATMDINGASFMRRMDRRMRAGAAQWARRRASAMVWARGLRMK